MVKISELNKKEVSDWYKMCVPLAHAELMTENNPTVMSSEGRAQFDMLVANRAAVMAAHLIRAIHVKQGGVTDDY